MKTPTLESCIPIPERIRGGKKPSSEKIGFLKSMQVGQSFTCRRKQEGCWRFLAKKAGFSITSRKVDSSTSRIWRTA